VLVTTRVVPEVACLRSRVAYRAVQDALTATLKRGYDENRFRVCQISIQGTHLHMLIEADNREALSRGMQGFLVSCAKRLNAAAKRKGRVFAGPISCDGARDPEPGAQCDPLRAQQLAQARRGPRRSAEARSDELGVLAVRLGTRRDAARARQRVPAGVAAEYVAAPHGMAQGRADLAVGPARARAVS
jgi:hypothetical protein